MSIERWNAGERLSASKANRINERLYRQANLTATGPVLSSSGPMGRTIQLWDQGAPRREMDGSLTQAGTNIIIPGVGKIDKISIKISALGSWITLTFPLTGLTEAFISMIYTPCAPGPLAAHFAMIAANGFTAKEDGVSHVWPLFYMNAKTAATATLFGLKRGAWFGHDPAGDVVVTLNSIVLHDVPLGTIQLFNDVRANIPYGWEPYTAMAGHFPVGYQSGTTEYGLGDTHGYARHGLSENNHGHHLLGHEHDGGSNVKYDVGGASYVGDLDNDDDPPDLATFDVDEWTSCESGAHTKPVGVGSSSEAKHTGLFTPGLQSAGASDTDNRPPYKVIDFIIRDDTNVSLT